MTRRARWAGSPPVRAGGCTGGSGRGAPAGPVGVVVGERDGEMAELRQPFGEEGARISAGGTAVSKCGEHDHGVALIGHDEMEPVEREVRCDQRTVNLDAPQAWLSASPGTHLRETSRPALRRRRGAGRPAGAAALELPPTATYPNQAGCNSRANLQGGRPPGARRTDRAPVAKTGRDDLGGAITEPASPHPGETPLGLLHRRSGGRARPGPPPNPTPPPARHRDWLRHPGAHDIPRVIAKRSRAEKTKTGGV